MPPEADDYAQLLEIAIEDPSLDGPQALATQEYEIIEDQSFTDSPGTRLIAITQGNRTREDDSKHVEVQGNEDDNLQVFVTPDPNTAIGMFIHTVEQHGRYTEDEAMDGFRHPDLDIDIEAYLDWVNGLTIDERQRRLLRDAEQRRDRSPHVETYLEEGSFRTVAPNPTVERVGQKLSDGLDPNPRRCYRNAIVALNTLKETDHVQYVEGLALPKQAGRAACHAWIEIHGAVVELTWPWHAPLPPEETIYYGVPIETETVLETTRRRTAGFNPILLEDDLLFSDQLGQQ